MKTETGAGQRAVGNAVDRATGDALGSGQCGKQIRKVHALAASALQ